MNVQHIEMRLNLTRKWMSQLTNDETLAFSTFLLEYVEYLQAEIKKLKEDCYG